MKHSNILKVQKEYTAELRSLAQLVTLAVHSFHQREASKIFSSLSFHTDCLLALVCYTNQTTYPLQQHLVALCLGRKNRFLGGFFMSSLRKAL